MSAETIGLLLAINSGVLSVVGLITIFISMNSQHNVQHSREILWSIFTLPYKKNLFLEKGTIGQEVFRKFILYEQIINEKNAFLIKIISFSQMVLTFSIGIWTTIVFNALMDLPPVDRVVLLLGLFLALCFLFYFILKILGDLKSISKVGQLPTVEELLDANLLTNNSNVITIAAVSSRLKILDTDIYLGFPIPFKNLMVQMLFRNSTEKEDNFTVSKDSRNIADRINKFKKLDHEDFKLLDDDYCYYFISNLQSLGEQRNSFFATLELISKQGYVAVEFYCEGLDSTDNQLIVYPYSFDERFVNRKSELDPFSRYLNSIGNSSLGSNTDWINTGKSFMSFLNKE